MNRIFAPLLALATLAPLAVPLIGCTSKPPPRGTQLFLVGQAGGSPQLSTIRRQPGDRAIGWTIGEDGAVPRANHAAVFAVSDGPLMGMVGSQPGFAGAPSHAIGYVALSPFAHSLKLVVSNAQRVGQLGDGSKLPKEAEAFGYAIAERP